MAQAYYFPRVSARSGTVNIVGFWHGFPGYKPPKEIAKAVGIQVASSKPQDYFVREGSPFDSQNKPDLMAQFLSQVPAVKRREDGLALRTEKAEFYFDTTLWNEKDMKVHSVQMKSLEYDPNDLVNRWSGITLVTPEEVEDSKKSFIASLEGAIDGISLEEIIIFAEKQQTLRSLLLARTAKYRAEALSSYPEGGNVYLMIGCMHAGEALGFLKNPDSIDEYLSRSHEEIREVYGINEEVQRQITESFHLVIREAKRGGAKLNPVQKTWALKQIVDIAHKRYLEIFTGSG